MYASGHRHRLVTQKDRQNDMLRQGLESTESKNQTHLPLPSFALGVRMVDTSPLIGHSHHTAVKSHGELEHVFLPNLIHRPEASPYMANEFMIGSRECGIDHSYNISSVPNRSIIINSCPKYVITHRCHDRCARKRRVGSSTTSLITLRPEYAPLPINTHSCGGTRLPTAHPSHTCSLRTASSQQSKRRVQYGREFRQSGR